MINTYTLWMMEEETITFARSVERIVPMEQIMGLMNGLAFHILLDEI
jgi:hypothetical protein